MRYRDLPPEWRATILAQRRKDRESAQAFVRVCKDDRPDLLYNAALWLDEGLDAWRLALTGVAKLRRVSPEIQDAFSYIWVERKMLPLRVGNRRVVSNALRVLMPANYHLGGTITLFRGTSAHERQRRIYGFSWSTDPAVARQFAQARHAPSFGIVGILLKTRAPPKAVLLMRQPEDYYDEWEVVVDPYRIRQGRGRRTLTRTVEGNQMCGWQNSSQTHSRPRPANDDLPDDLSAS